MTADATRQLPLPIQLRASSVFGSYYAGANAAVIATLQAPAPEGNPSVFLYGVPGVGKTHLLQALCVQVGERQQAAAYLPLRQLQGYGPELLKGYEQHAVLCLDDVAEVLPDPDWNRALFHLYHELEERRGRLILADEQPPAAIDFALPDLSSRLLAGSVLRLQPLHEVDQLPALRLRALQLGLELPDEVARFLLRRLPRDMSSLCDCLERLDHASLSAQRKLTVPFVRQALQRWSEHRPAYRQ